MIVYENLPPLSPRAGFLRAVSGWLDAALVEFGPEGTMHYAQSSIGGDVQNLFTTGLEEKQIIFGDTDNLEDAIRELDRIAAPKVLFVTSSPVSEIIGTDLEGLCHRLQQEVSARLLCWDRIPMEGREELGFEQAHTMAAQALTQTGLPREAGENRALVLGLDASAWNGTADVNEIRRMLRDYLGVALLNRQDGKYSLSDVRKADWILVADPCALPLATAAQTLWGTPWYCGLPYGISGSHKMLCHAEKALKLNRHPEWQEESRRVSRIIFNFRMNTPQGIHPLRIDVRESRQRALLEFLTEEAGLPFQPPQDATTFCKTGMVGPLQDVSPGTVFLGCGAACELHPQAATLCLDYPTLSRQMLTPYIPYTGIQGAANLLHTLYPFLQ